MKYQLEIIGFTIDGCRTAQDAGADRIELCDSASDGGTTPSKGFIIAARKLLSIELYPILRPRAGDFLYTEEEFNMMLEDVRVCKDAGCDGIVTGILKADGSIDKERCSRIVELAYPMGAAFHRAFDRCRDLHASLEDLVEMGFERVLTSGGKPTALESATSIETLVKQAGDRISIMPGSGVRADNILMLAEKTKAFEFHSSARTAVSGKMEYINPAMKENLQNISVDANEVTKMLEQLQKLQSQVND